MGMQKGEATKVGLFIFLFISLRSLLLFLYFLGKPMGRGRGWRMKEIVHNASTEMTARYHRQAKPLFQTCISMLILPYGNPVHTTC